MSDSKQFLKVFHTKSLKTVLLRVEGKFEDRIKPIKSCRSISVPITPPKYPKMKK